MTELGFFVGGIGRLEQYFDASTSQTIGMLLLLAVLSLVVPTVSHLLTVTPPDGILKQSRGISIIILISYGLYLYFQLGTNRELFNKPPQKARQTANEMSKIEAGAVAKKFAEMGRAIACSSAVDPVYVDEEEEEQEDVPRLSLTGGCISMVITIVLIAFNTQFAADSIDGLLREAGLSQTFLGLVILPILSNDLTSVVVVARQDRMDMSISLTLEKCMQTALMVVPFVVLLAWMMDVEMTLEFDGFPIAALFASIIIVTYVVQERKSNW
jgi:Ca2+:H+ antiporter